MGDAPAPRLDADKEAGDRPDPRILCIGGVYRRRAPALIVPFGHVGARPDLHPADRLALLESQKPRRRAGCDARLDVILVALTVAGATLRRRQPEMRAPAAVTGTLLAEKVLEVDPTLRRQRYDGRAHAFSPGQACCRPCAVVPLHLFSLCSQRCRLLSIIPNTVFAETAWRCSAARRAAASAAVVRVSSAIPSSTGCTSPISIATPSTRRSKSATIRR